MISKLTDNYWLLFAVFGTVFAYAMAQDIYQVQAVYERVWESKATLVWFVGLFGWQVMSGRIAQKIGGDVKRNGWILYFAGIIPLVVYVLA